MSSPNAAIRRTSLFAALALACAGVSSPALGLGIDHVQAADIAAAAAPRDAVVVEVEDKRFDERPKFEVELIRDDGRVLYKIDLDAETGDVRRIRDERQRSAERAEWRAMLDRMPNLDLTLADAIAKAYSRYPNAMIVKTELELEHGQLEYKIELIDSNRTLEIRVNGEDGRMDDPNGGGAISLRRAINIVRRELDRGDLMKIEIEREHGVWIYHTETVIRHGRRVIDLDLRQADGSEESRDVRSCDADDRDEYREILDLLPSAQIDFVGALNRVFNLVGNASALEIEFEEEHGVLFYKVKIKNADGTRSIYFVDAITGDVTEE